MADDALSSPTGSITPTPDDTAALDSEPNHVDNNGLHPDSPGLTSVITNDELATDSHASLSDLSQNETRADSPKTHDDISTLTRDSTSLEKVSADSPSPANMSMSSDAHSPHKSPEQHSPEGPKSPDAQSEGSGPSSPAAKAIESDAESTASGNVKNSSRTILSSDSEGETTPAVKRVIDSDDSDREEQTTPIKKKMRLSSEGSNDSDEKPDAPQSPDAQEEGGDAIADIFGDSSDDEGEFEGFDESELKAAATAESALPEVSSDEELDDDRHQKEGMVSDFDTMMELKKAERAGSRRKKRNVDIINDNDDLIVDMLKRMREAAEEDRTLNQNHQPATRKLTMLPTVTRQLNKAELQTAFLDCGLLSALTEWLAPLPDKSLPHLSIRQSLLKILNTLPQPHTDQLKSSGIGKAIMYLFKHPKEMRANRDLAGRLINEWSRPIFGQSSNMKAVNKDDLQQRDMKTLKNRRRSSDDSKLEDQRGLRPGDPGWVYRARVPRPSNRDYVVRPESTVEIESYSKGSSKKKKNRYEMQKQKMDNKKKSMKALSAVKISIEGNKMSL